MATTADGPNLGAVVGALEGAAPMSEDRWAEVKGALQEVMSAMGDFKAELEAVRSCVTPPKGKEKVQFSNLASSPGPGGEAEELDASVMPGKGALDDQGDDGLPLPVFVSTAAPSSAMVSPIPGPSAATSKALPTEVITPSVVATTYPSSWSSYLTPAAKGSLASKLGTAYSLANLHPVRAVPAFSGAETDDVHLWISQVELRGAQAGWDETTLMAQASAALEGPAALWLHTAEPDVLFRFDRFKQELKRSFSALSRVDLLKDYLQCRQERGETVRNFYHRILMLQKRAGLEDDDLMATRFREGLRADLRRSVATLPNSSSIAKLRERASEYESRLRVAKSANVAAVVAEERSAIQEVREEMRDLRDDLRDVVAWVRSGPPPDTRRPARPMAEVQCYQCRGWGHYARNCPKTTSAPATPAVAGGAAPVAPSVVAAAPTGPGRGGSQPSN